jgi:hypothetical protein
MESIQTSTLELQDSNVTLADARDHFNLLLKDFPAMAPHLASNAAIVEDYDFENGIVKIQTGKEATFGFQQPRTVLSDCSVTRGCYLGTYVNHWVPILQRTLCFSR